MANMIPAGFRALPLSAVQLSLDAVLKCGQSFRWSIFPLQPQGLSLSAQPTHEYRLCLRDRVVCLRQSRDALFYRAVFPDPQPSIIQLPLKEAETLVWINDYFQLNVDLETLYEEWSCRDEVFAKIRYRFAGIRILRQDPWEALVSFICSSNNNISRITKMVIGLCKQYSAPLLSISDPLNAAEQQTYHPVPPPSALAGPKVGAALRTLGFGYRAEFIQRTAQMLVDAHGTSTLQDDPSEASERWLKDLRGKSTEEAREELLKFIGVGRKVADCILLMSLDKKDVIPVDTHVYQIAIKHYGFKGTKTTMTPKLYEDVNKKLVSILGDYAGWAHTVLFTADLKAFSAYGLSTPPTSRPITPQKKLIRNVLPTPPLTPLPLSLKRGNEFDGAVPISRTHDQSRNTQDEGYSLAERIKRRKRSTQSTGSS